jgi:hypothetical protein
VIYTPSRIPGAWIIDLDNIGDARGFFAMSWLPHELSERGMNPALAQCNLAFNYKRGTLRGMHFQKALHAQAKIIRATRGSLLDVIVDLLWERRLGPEPPRHQSFSETRPREFDSFRAHHFPIIRSAEVFGSTSTKHPQRPTSPAGW